MRILRGEDLDALGCLPATRERIYRTVEASLAPQDLAAARPDRPYTTTHTERSRPTIRPTRVQEPTDDIRGWE